MKPVIIWCDAIPKQGAVNLICCTGLQWEWWQGYGVHFYKIRGQWTCTQCCFKAGTVLCLTELLSVKTFAICIINDANWECRFTVKICSNWVKSESFLLEGLLYTVYICGIHFVCLCEFATSYICTYFTTYTGLSSFTWRYTTEAKRSNTKGRPQVLYSVQMHYNWLHAIIV